MGAFWKASVLLLSGAAVFDPDVIKPEVENVPGLILAKDPVHYVLSCRLQINDLPLKLSHTNPHSSPVLR